MAGWLGKQHGVDWSSCMIGGRDGEVKKAIPKQGKEHQEHQS